jgi:aminomuconate-semialdehyde/2-hydroxymuconate-6-semialdehyde dehydrogenase
MGEPQQCILNYIDGQLSAPVSGAFIDTINPATGEIYALIPDADARDVAMAVAAAERAFPAWSATLPEERFRLMNRVADLIESRLEAFALAETTDSGKPIKVSRSVDIPRAIANFRFFATAAMQFASEAHPMPGKAINYTLRQSLGVVGCISPWNLPLYLFTWKIAPALAAGNCVVGKPSELTPMTAFLLSEVCIEAGLPAGVLNIVHGLGGSAGQAIVEHPGVKAISFTGGTHTGRQIAALAAPMFKKLSLELGGKNANIVFADSDFEEAVATAVRAGFSNNGQICLCGSRLYVERSIYDRFREVLAERVSALRVGDPLEEENELGALVSAAHLEKVQAYIQLAREEGGVVLTGGDRMQVPGRCGSGYFMRPALIEGLPAICRTNQEEIFGPVLTLQPFDTEEEVLLLANGVDYGLATTVWTKDIARAHRVAERLQSGIVWINCWMLRDLRTPFGGQKQSGVGREGGWEAMRFFTEPKNVCVQYG